MQMLKYMGDNFSYYFLNSLLQAFHKFYYSSITQPQLLLADEPTGALDSKAAKELLRLFTHLNQDGQTILMVTHSVKAASTAGRVLFIKDGKVFHQIYKGSLSEAQMYQKISDTMTAITAGGEDDE